MKSSPEKRIVFFDLRFVLKKNLWIFFVILAALLLLIPFSTAGLPGNSIFNLEVTHLQMKFRFYTPEMVPAILAVLPLSGLLAACVLFRFLLRKKDASIMLSAGITRRNLFLNRVLAGSLMLFLAVAIPMAVSIWLNLRALGNYTGLFTNGIFLTAGMFVSAMTGFFVAAICIFASGTIAESVLYWFGLMLFPSGICTCVNLLLNRLFFGNAYGATATTGSLRILPSLTDSGAFWNPLLFFRESLETNGRFIRPLETAIPDPINVSVLLTWILICLALAFLSFYMLKRHKAESAGITACHPVLSECVILLSSLFVFSEAVSLLYPYSPFSAFLLGVLAFCAIHLFWRKAVFSYHARKKRTFVSFLTDAAVLTGICLVCAPVMNLHVKQFLASDSIIRAEMTYTGAPSYLYAEASGSTSGRGYYLPSTVSFTSDEAISLICRLQNSMIDMGRQPLRKAPSAEQTCIPYDITFTYEDDHGRSHTWYYDRALFEQLEAMLDIEKTQEFQSGISTLFRADNVPESGRIFSQQAYQNSDLYLVDPSLTDAYHLTLEPYRRQELLNALSHDIQSMSAEDRYFPVSSPRAVLLFSGTGEQDCKYFTYHLDNAYLYINGSWSETMNWLTENDLLGLLSQQPEAEEIYLQRFDPYIGINRPKPMGLYFMAYCGDTPDEFMIQKDFGLKYTISDPEEIQTLLPLLQDGCFMSRGGFLVCVKYKGEEKYRYFFLPQELVPDFIRG